MWLYIVMYSIVRFTLEFARGDNPIYAFGLTISQIISLVAFAAMILLAYPVWFRMPPRRHITDGGKDPDSEKKEK